MKRRVPGHPRLELHELVQTCGSIVRLFLIVFTIGLACGARADEIAVDLELVLAVDVSLSMDADEQKLQRDGYVEAFRDPDVVRAIRSNGHGRIGVTYIEWAGSQTQKVTMGWTLVDGEAAARGFADKLAAQPILRAQRTSISGALLFAAQFFEGSGFKGKRRVIDVSGDGPNNDGVPVTPVRDQLVANGITINGLPILLKAPSGWFDIENLDEYYEDCVIGGFAAFSIAVRTREEFARAIKRKLLLEIAETRPGLPGGTGRVIKTQARAPAKPRVSCLIGEERWDNYMGGRRREF